MNFGEAIEAVKLGGHVARESSSSRVIWMTLPLIDHNNWNQPLRCLVDGVTKATLHYLFEDDYLAEDWYVVEQDAANLLKTQ